jgi:DNA-binding IclR family transcriptional regulator
MSLMTGLLVVSATLGFQERLYCLLTGGDITPRFKSRKLFLRSGTKVPRDSQHDLRGVLARYAMILETVAAGNAGLSLTEIMRGTGLSSGTTHRLVKALLEVGYLAPVDGRKAYRIGPRMSRLLHLAHSRASLSMLVQPVLEGLVSRFGETAFVAKLSGSGAESVAVAVPGDYTQSYVQPGRLMPLNAAASAKAIFAFQDAAVIEKALVTPLRRYTEKTIVDPAALRRNLQAVREQGFAVCADELDPGVLSYACPIHLPGTGVLYSLGIVALSRRLMEFDEREVIGAVKDAARLIAVRLRGELNYADGAPPPS